MIFIYALKTLFLLFSPISTLDAIDQAGFNIEVYPFGGYYSNRSCPAGYRYGYQNGYGPYCYYYGGQGYYDYGSSYYYSPGYRYYGPRYRYYGGGRSYGKYSGGRRSHRGHRGGGKKH